MRFHHGPEFIAYAVADWCRFKGTGTVFIDPGSPWQNAWIESFNGRMRDEHLNGAVPGRASTTSRSPPAPESRGSTRSVCTQSSTTPRRPSSRPSTVKDLSPTWHEKPNHRASVNPGRFTPEEGLRMAETIGFADIAVCSALLSIRPSFIPRGIGW